jgi:hypothetical protein
MTTATLLLRSLTLGAIRVYQRTLSLDHGVARYLVPAFGRCRFHPTCSVYGATAIARFGILRGGALAARRVLRCNPWSRGGVDAVPFESK